MCPLSLFSLTLSLSVYEAQYYHLPSPLQVCIPTLCFPPLTWDLWETQDGLIYVILRLDWIYSISWESFFISVSLFLPSFDSSDFFLLDNAQDRYTTNISSNINAVTNHNILREELQFLSPPDKQPLNSENFTRFWGFLSIPFSILFLPASAEISN